ncbi:hypothetical protein ACJIZ3_015571 [Penstemon smallii]|uniref:QWRF motif-containing protein 2 n=1 Tax=Penstemon smallii TaxID=265156 RepID=A0ABD3RN46_9LAMI
MVAAVSGLATDPQITDELTKRSPLLPSEKDHSSNGVTNNKRKPKSKIVSSRYMSPSPSTSTSTSTSNSSSVSSYSSSSSKKYPFPLVSQNSTPIGPKRAVSVDRRRPASIRPLAHDLDSKNANGAAAATKILFTSTRSLSVSFQGEAFSLPVSKTKVAPPSPNLTSVRKGTPERKRTSTPLRGKGDGGGDLVENSKPIDQHRWPARNRTVNNLSRRPSVDGNRLSLDLVNSELLKARNSIESDLTASDSDSVSSGSTSGVQECSGASHGLNVPRGIVVSARFWQETNSRLRKLQDSGSPLSKSPGSNLMKLKRYTSDGNFTVLSPRTTSSPIRGGIRPASPSKVMTPVGLSPSRGYSPSRIRNAVSTINNNFTETPSVLSFAVDVRRGKVGESRIVDAHLLRLFYNRHLQWRFVNARTEAVLLVQKHSVQKCLWNAWITISDLRDSVTKKRHRLQLLRQKLKLASILEGQMTFLEDWASLDKDNSISLLGAIEALKATTLRLPVVGGAIADVQSLKDAISSAVDVMQTMASSMCSLLPTVNEVNSLVTELAKVTAKERALLEQCTYFISLLASMQVKDSSLRTHILQHNRLSRD